MLNASLREQMNRKRAELYQEARRRERSKKAYETRVMKYLGGLAEDKEFVEFLEASDERIIFLRSKEGVQISDNYGVGALYALAYAARGLEKYVAPSHCSKKREFSLIRNIEEAVKYVVKLGESRGKFFEVEEIEREIESRIAKLLKKL